jgi:hypothetical protein
MQLHLVELGPQRTLRIYLPTARAQMLQRAQKRDEDLPYWAFFWPPSVGMGMLLSGEPLLA